MGLSWSPKIKVDDINCVTLVHHARHRFLEDQQIGGRTDGEGNHADAVRLTVCERRTLFKIRNREDI